MNSRVIILCWLALSCVSPASCGSREITGDASTENGSDSADAPDEDDCTIEYHGRPYHQSDFYLCGTVEGCHPAPDPLCPGTIPCPGSPCDLGASPSCDYCTSVSGIPSGTFAYAVCEGDSWTIGFTHCEPYYECTLDMDCDDDDPCTSDACIMRWCTYEAVDEDGDRHTAAMVDGVECGGDDCDDSRPDIYPGAAEGCGDGEDLDCSGTPDRDDDDDGYVDERCVPEGDDCDDLDPDVHPEAVEVCMDGIDQDCDGHVDGPLLEIAPVRIGEHGGYPEIVWTGSEFGVAWNTPAMHVRVSADGTFVGPETPIDGGSGNTGHVSMAWTGSEFIVTWHAMWIDLDIQKEVYIARVSGSGEMIGGPELVTDPAEHCFYPDITWSGSELGLTFASTRPSVNVYFARFDGTVARLSDDLEIEAADLGSYPKIAWTGSEYGVSWSESTGSDYDVLLARLSPAGTRRSAKLIVNGTGGQNHGHELAWAGSGFGVVWFTDLATGAVEDWEVHVARANGSATGVHGITALGSTAGGSVNPDVDWTGSDYGAVWDDSRIGSCPPAPLYGCNQEIYFARVDTTGTVTSDEFRVTSDTTYSRAPSLAWSGSEFGVTWYDGDSYDVYFVRISLCE